MGLGFEGSDVLVSYLFVVGVGGGGKEGGGLVLGVVFACYIGNEWMGW